MEDRRTQYRSQPGRLDNRCCKQGILSIDICFLGSDVVLNLLSELGLLGSVPRQKNYVPCDGACRDIEVGVQRLIQGLKDLNSARSARVPPNIVLGASPPRARRFCLRALPATE